MLNQEMLLELTESYLKSLVAETSVSLGADFDSSSPFGELGIDSFRVLKIIKVLEADFGTLPKTLLFENFNVDALAQYFVDKHRQTLSAKFSKDHQSSRQAPVDAVAGNAPVQSVSAQNARPALVVQPPTAAPSSVQKTPIRLLEKDLPKHPELEALIKDLFERYKNEGCVSRGTRNIAPNLFIGSERKGYFNYSRSNRIVLIYAYTGAIDYFPEIAKEMYRHCVEKNFQLNIFGDEVIESIDGVPFSATPFGALQRVLKLQNFTLEGGPMRRLRYQVSKFEKAGTCRTQEYKCGTDKDVDKSIADVIDRWCATKTMVNPLIHIVREEILAGTLHPQHRIFLTYQGDTLQNVILISAMCSSLNGYLMDLEFYGPDMPLGGLEFAIVKIIEALAPEGCSMFSLGGTYGCRLESSPHADPAVDKILDDLHKQNIFSDDGNLQFKNKFRPENRTIYLCRPIGSGNADNVIDLIMMIADPAKTQTSDEENHNVGAELLVTDELVAIDGHARLLEGEARSPTLSDFGFNPLNIPNDRIDYDLKSDSWALLDIAPFVEKQMGHLRAQLQQPANVNESLSSVFPFKYFALTDAGRTAEHLFCKAWPKKGIVLQNLLFPTCIYHQIDMGFTPRELPHPEVFRLDSDEVYKSNLDWDALQDTIARHADEIAYVCIEVSDNAAGGHPVSVQHLKQVKDLLAAHSISLVIDGTRILENAQYLIEHEPQYAGRTLWDVAKEVLSYADVVIGSLAKDFCVNKGGLIATNDENLLRRVQDLMRQEGGGLNVIEKKLIALALQNRRQIEAWVVRRMRAVESIWQALKDEQVPVVRPAGGHCVLIDVKGLPEFRDFENPVASFLAWLYLNTGIRAGAHSVGMQKNSPINEQVRLAIPVGLKKEQTDDILGRLVRLFREKRNIPELKLRGASESFGGVHDHYDLVRYHGVAATASPLLAAATPVAVSEKTLPKPLAPVSPVTSRAPMKSAVSSASRTDIAIVGMAGRYPKAKNIPEFWENLKEGKDSVGDIPQDRIARRAQNEFTQGYRGGFLEDVDKFDSLFFNISPREAEFLDPQERLFLEVAWEVLEDAGYYPEILAQENASRNVGVFVGAVWAMYQIIGVEEKLSGNNLNPNSFLWSIANRVSYWMNFTGPSLTVDTACSSSLTAIYLACESIHNGDCSSAIVGGVNLDLHQHKFDINHNGGALSSDGVCRSFGAGANGYVAGEGVGAIFLKPLDKALEDNDNIYGVIKSAVVNHGGRTSGYTVPNPKAQGDLIAAALEKAGVDARTIGYIEAHGTGTELGDPVEISGLTKAFESYKVGNQTCPIGSVKTNIGHLEAAAGVVGVCKVLLQMKYRQLVPSLHSAQLNEYIDFKNSPFYVQQRLEAWNEKEIDGVWHPLRAGLSCFGAGGANAHIVFESYELKAVEPASQAGGYLFPLSARNDEQLREMAIRMRNHLELDCAEHKLNDIAFTLENGRKSFEHRLVVVAKTAQELITKLDLFLEGKKDADVLSGHAKNSEGITKLLSRKEKEQFVGLLSQSRDPHKLAQLWIDGLLSDCHGFAQTGGRRTSLPTYPFADKRHWIGAGNTATKALSLQTRSGMHPLIDSNESTFQRQLFRKAFRAQEFFLRDHVVSNVPTLPGTAYLDLARKAGEIATGRKVRKIKNVTWVSPLTAEGSAPTEALIELTPSADSVLFEVFSEGADGKRKLYAQGKLHYTDEHAANAEPEYIDIDAIRARCAKVIEGKDAYPLFKSVGLNYGPSFQVLQEVFKNEDEVLGLLRLPDVRSADFDDFILHPCILDASMQAGVAGQLGDKLGEMKVPYSIGEVELLHPLTRCCYSYVTKVKSDRNTSSGVSRENVTIVDESGRVLVRIRESVGVPLASVHEKPAPIQKEDEFVELYYSHVWQKSPLANAPSDVRSVLLFDTDDRLFNACVERNIKAILVLPSDKFEDLGNDTYGIDPQDNRDYSRLFAALRRRNWIAEKICYAWPDSSEPGDEGALERALASGVYAFLFFCQTLIEQKQTGKVQILYLYFGKQNAIQAHNEAINGFARSLRLENPKVDCKVLEIRQDNIDPNDVLNEVLAELHSGAQDEITVRYEGSNRYARTLKRIDPAQWEGAGSPARSPEVALKQNGVYLITGGAGGLGLIFAEFLAKQCKATLVLTGRSELSGEREAQLENLRKMGAEVLYIPADVSKSADVRRVVDQSKSRFGGINGIIHSAGVLRDSLLRKKTHQEMGAVFAPKIFGTFHLDQQTRDEDLDFFVTFSSLAAIGGNMGQCDYAFANHYMDSFAASREALRADGKRSGRTLSLNWSLWADGGMRLDEQTEIFFKKNLGIKPLNKEVGLDAFVRGLPLDRPQIVVLQGVQAKIEQAWGLTKKVVAPTPVPASPQKTPAGASSGTGGEDLSGLVMRALSNTVMEMLKLGADDLSLDAILLDLGFDSIGLTTFANAINDKYQLEINAVLFFEYPSIRAIAGVLATEHRSAVEKAHSSGKPAAAQAMSAQSVAATANAESDAKAHFEIKKNWAPDGSTVSSTIPRGDFSREHRFVDMPIAIVGIGGVMPQSENLEQFWDNLKNARNLVTEIPRDRWIWEDYFGNPLKEANKSNSKWGGFMKDVDKFDPLFFGITPREAQMMDPQQRIFIETVWSAIEDSGHKVSDLSGTKTGLFVGVSAKDYIDVLVEHHAVLDGYSASGNSHSILANRVSYLFNLRGPSAPLDTACSSSLVALHRAVESIHTGSSDMAIVGGVQVMLTPAAHITLSLAGMLSTDGKCKTFNKDANGYVRGEGAGAIFIKPLAKAEADGNHIYAIIKATTENHGGRVTNLTAPNPKAQAELLTEAYEKAQVDPATVGYIECHGTGTGLGDPIEIQALKKSFSDLYKKHNKAPPEKPHCGLSSVKTNIGHLEPAAGIAGLLKVLLAIRHKQIPALLHFDEINPFIDLKNSPFYIVDKTTPWDAMKAADGTALPRRAGVSAFGWGGANAHIVLEEYLPQERHHPDRSGAPLPIVLSAKNADRLKAYARSMLAHVETNDVDLADFAYTLQVGRDAMTERLGFLAGSVEELIAKLKAYIAVDVDGEGAANGIHEGIHRGKVSRNKEDINLIGQDDDIKESVIEKLIAGNKWSKLLDLWVKGLDLDWSMLIARGGLDEARPAVGPKRISLPTYPFARERHWIDTTAKARKMATDDRERARPSTDAQQIIVDRQTTRAQEASQQLFFHEVWQQQPASELGSSPHNKRTIIFADESLKNTIAADNDAGRLADAVFVYQAESYRQVSERVYQCHFNDLSGIQEVLAHVSTEPGQAIEIVYAWSRNRKEAGVHALFQLFKAIKESARAVSHVTLVGEYDPSRADTCWDYSWIGFERSLKLYLAKTEISLLYSDTSSITVRQLLEAARRGGVVWYRGGQRLALSYKSFEPNAQAQPPVLKQGGGYLITGGGGVLGLKFAHHLAANYRAKLLLLGRSPMSPEIQHKLDALRQAGAQEAHYHSVDLGDAEAMAAWAQNLPFDLSGVIHAAGVESKQAFFEKSAAEINQVLHPKTVGTVRLDEVLEKQSLDFVCYFSSSSALLGDFGSCDYAIANRFQMAYGQYRQQNQRENSKTVVINWPMWAEGGMGVADPQQAALYLKRTGLDALSTVDGIDIWHQLMRADQRQALVMVGYRSRIDNLMDKIYRIQKPERVPALSAVEEKVRTGIFTDAVKVKRRTVNSGNLNMNQIEKLRKLLKADFLSLQEGGK
jgi:polyketide synthase PksN